jgi:hypothetical protein
MKYNVDIVLCIDCTGSMGATLDAVKEHALRFHLSVEAALAKKQKSIDQFRLRVIAFRDFFVDEQPLMAMPDFLDLRTDAEAFQSFVRGLNATGGGDEPENALEALALAIRSPWNRAEQAKARHLIVVWTDASAHPLEKAAKSRPAAYPPNMPANLDELTELWEEMNNSSRRLIIYAPDAEPWNIISESWPQSVFYPSQAGEGLEEIDFQLILDTMANSI